MLGGSLLLRRTMLDELGGYDAGFRMYGEEIDLCYRAARAGWERWYVPDAVVTPPLGRAHRPARFLTRRTLWHWRSILRFVRKHPELAGRRGETTSRTWTDREYADPVPYLRHRGELVAGARAAARAGRPARRPRLRRRRPRRLPPRDRVPRRRRATAMVDGGARRRAAPIEHADLNEFDAGRAGRGDDALPRDLLHARPAGRSSAHVAGYTEQKVVFDLNPRQYRVDDVDRRSARRRAAADRAAPVLRAADAAPFPARSALRSVAARANGTAGAPRAALPLHATSWRRLGQSELRLLGDDVVVRVDMPPGRGSPALRAGRPASPRPCSSPRRTACRASGRAAA